jgi:hypothetical protein
LARAIPNSTLDFWRQQDCKHFSVAAFLGQTSLDGETRYVSGQTQACLKTKNPNSSGGD